MELSVLPSPSEPIDYYIVSDSYFIIDRYVKLGQTLYTLAH